MTSEEEKQLRSSLQNLSKDRIIELFIKMKKAYLKTCKQLIDAEDELIEKTSLEELISELPDDYEHCSQKRELIGKYFE